MRHEEIAELPITLQQSLQRKSWSAIQMSYPISSMILSQIVLRGKCGKNSVLLKLCEATQTENNLFI